MLTSDYGCLKVCGVQEEAGQLEFAVQRFAHKNTVFRFRNTFITPLKIQMAAPKTARVHPSVRRRFRAKMVRCSMSRAVVLHAHAQPHEAAAKVDGGRGNVGGWGVGVVVGGCGVGCI